MTTVTVFVLLLDNLPDFANILNSNLQNAYINVNVSINLTHCNPHDANLIWAHVNKKYTNESKATVKSATREKGEEALRNILRSNDILDYFLYDSVSKEISLTPQNTNNDNSNFPFQNHIVDKIENNSSALKIIDAEIRNPAPFLVAIFESLSNITAQTCGGTLVSSHWVLTSASCVDLLPRFYKNITKQNSNLTSVYSIIVNASNPLLDGTVHNVTKIIIHPTQEIDSLKYPNLSTSPLAQYHSRTSIPILALMKIEPATTVQPVKLLKKVITTGLDVKVYGWILDKNSSEQDVMNIGFFKARTVDLKKCNARYGFIAHKAIICLSTNDKLDNTKKMLQMSSGGPVGVAHAGGELLVLAVAQVDSRSPFIAYSLSPHYSWIQDVIRY